MRLKPVVAGGDRELVDHCHTHALPYQRADRGAEPGPDRDVIGEPGVEENPGHDPSIGVVGIDADQRIGDDVPGHDGCSRGQRMALRHDAEQAPSGQRLEGQHRVIVVVAHRDHLAASEQQVVDRLLQLEDVDIDQQLGKACGSLPMARGTITVAMLGTEPILSTASVPLSILAMTNCRSSTFSYTALI